MRPTNVGAGRALVALYAILALAAVARGAYQVATKRGEAPVAYLLSLASGLVYVLATVALATDRRRLAWMAVLVEAAGVVLVGVASLVWPGTFRHPTVWSVFGQGYGYVPLALPFCGIAWLVRTGRAGRDTSAVEVPEGEAPAGG